MKRMSPAEERFFQSLQQWTGPDAQRRERVLDSGTDVDAEVERRFSELLGRASIPPA